MKDPKYAIKQRKRKPKFWNEDGWRGGVSLKDMPIYPDTSSGGFIHWGVIKYMELGDGYWIEAQTGANATAWIDVHHRHDNGKSVSRSIDSQCATCKEYMPDWVKGSLNLIKWSMADEKAQNTPQE